MRRLPRNILVVAGNIISRSRDINGLAHGTRVPGIRAMSFTWGLLSTVVLTRYLRSFIRVEGFASEENFDDSVCYVQVVSRPDSVEYLEEFIFCSTEEINRVQCPAFLQQLTFGSHFNHGLRRAARPSAPQFFSVVGDDFDHYWRNHEFYRGRGYRWFCPVCCSKIKVMLLVSGRVLGWYTPCFVPL